MAPKFLWGVATSAFQLEGSPFADWTSWDGAIRSRPDATRHYHLYREDLDLLKDLGVNAYRFSLEWSRIQPEEGAWDEESLSHYGEIIDILNQNRIVPMLTVHHFTHPKWFIEKYSWHKAESVPIFMDYVAKILESVQGVRYWITFNEPYVLLLGGYLDGCMPPGLDDSSLALRALENILRCHAGAYDMIHSRIPDAMVSLAHNMASFVPWLRWNPLDRYLARIANDLYNHSLLDAALTGALSVRLPLQRQIRISAPLKGRLDFLGVNYYTRIHVRFNPFKKKAVDLLFQDRNGFGLTDMGWEIHPIGLQEVLRYASRLRLPVIITENGIAAQESHKKNEFMKRHLDVIEKCRADGMDIRGYFYWSLLDSYEWFRGFDARFGLYRVDFLTCERRRTASARYYSYLIRNRSAVFDKQPT